jgi:hypothetical protein
MRRFRTRGQKVALGATVLGVVLLLAVGYRALPDDSPEPTAEPAPSVSVSVPAPDVGTGELPDSFKKALDPGSEGQPGFGTSGKDPFDNMAGSTQIYHVKINLRTDGQMKFVYRYRTGYTDPKTASGSASVSKELRGPRAVAQVFVQLIGGSYATCSITIDGKTVSTTTAKKMYDVVACTG